MTPPTAPQQAQLDPQILARVKMRTLNHVVDMLTAELSYAHQQGEELEKKLAAALAENEALKKTRAPKPRRK